MTAIGSVGEMSAPSTRADEQRHSQPEPAEDQESEPAHDQGGDRHPPAVERMKTVQRFSFRLPRSIWSAPGEKEKAENAPHQDGGEIDPAEKAARRLPPAPARQEEVEPEEEQRTAQGERQDARPGGKPEQAVVEVAEESGQSHDHGGEVEEIHPRPAQGREGSLASSSGGFSSRRSEVEGIQRVADARRASVLLPSAARRAAATQTRMAFGSGPSAFNLVVRKEWP